MRIKIDGAKFGKKLKELRNEKGYTGEALAFEAGLSSREIVKLETNRLSPNGGHADICTLLSLAYALETTLDDLLYGVVFMIDEE